MAYVPLTVPPANHATVLLPPVPTTALVMSVVAVTTKLTIVSSATSHAALPYLLAPQSNP
jgi:hypothetical protein